MKTITTVLLVIAILLAVGYGQETYSSETTEQLPAVSLHMAVLQGNLEAVRQHIETGSGLDEKDAYGSTPLILAVTF